MHSKFQFHYYVPSAMSNLPQQGWKVHVSAFYDNYRKVLKKVAKYCYLKRIPFKYVLSIQLRDLLGKQASRLAAGKLITIYPKDDQQFEEIVLDLYKALRNIHGPYILTDRRYRNSRCLYYRYGTIARQNRTIYSKNGVPFQDASQPTYANPTLAKDPFIADHEKKHQRPLKLFSEYEITDVYRYSNFGGTYKAIRLSDNLPVIIKEARSYLGESERLTAIKLRKHEREILQKYATTGLLPEVVDSFIESENYYLITTRVKGKTLTELKNHIYLGGVSLDQPVLIEKIKSQIVRIAQSLNHLFKVAHQHGLFLNDVSLDNFVIDRNEKITFIDAEASNTVKSPLLTQTNTPDYNDDHMLIDDLTLIEIDNKRLGYMLIDLVCSANDLLRVDPSGKQTRKVFERFCQIYNFVNLWDLVATLEGWKLANDNCTLSTVSVSEITSEIEEITTFASTQHYGIMPDHEYPRFNIVQVEDVLKNLHTRIIKRNSNFFTKVDAEDLLNVTENTIRIRSPKLQKELQTLVYFLLRRLKNNGREYYGNQHYLFTNESGNYSPYLVSSGAVLFASLSSLKHFPDKKIIRLVKEILPSFDASVVRNVSYSYGLSGIADLFLTAYEILGDQYYLHSAITKFRVIQSFKAVSPNCRWLYIDKSLQPKFGHYDDGTPGILAFYRHLLNVLQNNKIVPQERELSHEIYK